MSYKISKELFEAVMDVKKECYLQDIELIDENKIIYSYLVDEQFQEPRYDEELINDFFFKCKEWAFEQAYQLESCKTNKLLEDNKFESIYMCGGFYQYSVIQNFYASSEQQAVFDACMYILDKDKQ